MGKTLGAQYGGHFERPRWGQRVVKPLVFVEEALAMVGGGQRLDIIRSLGMARANVSTLAERLIMSVPAVSRELCLLEQMGFVVHEQVKTQRIYSLSDRVRFHQKDQLMQIVIMTHGGTWVLIHLDDSGDAAMELAPPDGFVAAVF